MSKYDLLNLLNNIKDVDGHSYFSTSYVQN